MIIASVRVWVSRETPPLMSLHGESGICSLSEYLIFVMRMNHGREAPLARPRCDYTVSVTYTCKEPRTLYTAACIIKPTIRWGCCGWPMGSKFDSHAS